MTLNRVDKPVDGQHIEPESVTAEEIDIGALVASLDAAGYDITGLGAIASDAYQQELDGLGGIGEELTEYQFANDDDFTDRTKITADVSTAAKTIAEITNNGGQQAIVMVVGSDGYGGTDPTFHDLVHFSRFGPPNVFSTVESSNPPGRTYTENQNQLQLEMDSGTFDVRTRVTELGGVDDAGNLTADANTLVADGAFSVHQRPRAVQVGGKTIMGFTRSDGDIGVTSLDHSTGDLTETTLSSKFQQDDHASPGIYVRGDDRLVVFWTSHVGTGEDTETMYWKISDSAADISSFGAENSFTAGSQVDYPQPVTYNGNLRLYYRLGTGSGSAWEYRESTDGGASFGTAQPVADFVDNSWHYIHPYADGGRIHFAMGDHRMSDPGIYHWYLEDGDYYTSDGTVIQSAGSELTDLSAVTQVYDGTEENNPAKQYDLIVNNGEPYVAFTEHVETGTGGGDGDYRARWAKWDSGTNQWTVGSEITPMGGSLPETHYYEGGLSLDSADPSTVYVSVEQADRNYQIQEWTTDDGGATWTKVQDLSPADATLTDPTKRGRPISPRGHDGTGLSVVWWAGHYDHFSADYLTQIRRP